MRILFISYYYQPDLSAGSFRNTALVAELKKQMPRSSKIDIITTQPSRYGSYKATAPGLEKLGIETIHRVSVPDHHGRIFYQLVAFSRFAFETIKISSKNDYDIVYASSSRLMSAVLGSFIARRTRALLYLDIRDIFVDTIKSLWSSKFIWLILPLFKLLESWSFKSADKINLVSRGFEEYFRSRYPDKNFSWYSNGIDKEFIFAQPIKKYVPTPKNLEVLYAGNFGDGQGLHKILPDLSEKLSGKATFKLIGDGNKKKELLRQLSARNIENVQVLPPLKRKEIIEAYQKADILFLHLSNYEAFLKVLPSKIFEYAASGKPIWAGVSGFSAHFLKTEVENVALFTPGDVQSALKSFSQLDLATHPRLDFVNKYARGEIMKKMALDILEIEELGRC